MYRAVKENQWDAYAAKPFSIDLNEAFREVIPDTDTEDFYGSLAQAVFGLLTAEDKERLAFEGLRARAGSCIRQDRRPVRRSTNGSARWDGVVQARRAGLEDHYVQTGEGLKPLLECTAFDLENAIAYYDSRISGFVEIRDRYKEVLVRVRSAGVTVVRDLDGSVVERILDV